MYKYNFVMRLGSLCVDVDIWDVQIHVPRGDPESAKGLVQILKVESPSFLLM